MSEPVFTAEQIRIPPEFPDVLKNYAKAVLKDQPNDIFAYSVEYFQKAQKARPPLKKISDSQLGALYTKLAKLGSGDVTSTLSKTDISTVYDVVGASAIHIEEIFKLGGFSDNVAWFEAWALSSALSHPDLISAIAACQKVLSRESKNYTEPICSAFKYLASKDPFWTGEKIERVVGLVKAAGDSELDLPKYIEEVSKH